LKNLNQARELNESTYTGLEDRNHEETGYREIVTSDSNPNIANADANYPFDFFIRFDFPFVRLFGVR
jgi:hypothetical protein